MDIIENICHVCKNKNELEAVICGYCGTALNDPFMDPGAKTKTSDMPALMPGSRRDPDRDWDVDIATVPANGIAIFIEGQPQPSFVDSRQEILIGRRSETTTDFSLGLDLAPFGGYHLGLSRRHAVLRQTGHGYEVMDLGSVNGTFLNDERLIPHRFYPLPSGSFLRLGSMRLLLHYRAFA